MRLGACEDKGKSVGDVCCCPTAFEVLPIFIAVCTKESSWSEKDIKLSFESTRMLNTWKL